MKKKVFSVITLITLISTLISFAPTAQAKVTETDMGDYTEYVGNLGGAGFALLMPEPDDWNGKLVVFCHFYMDESMWSNDPKGGIFPTLGFNMFTDEGYAFAYSTFGEIGLCVQKGMIRTHQLTQWVIDHFGPEKVFLYGYSMGGNIALLLAEKYPMVYDGVLDVVGIKDYADLYYYYKYISELMGGDFDDSDYIAEFGGSPEEKPQAYEKRSPINNIDIRIPIITLYGDSDVVLPPAQHVAYASALEAAGVAEDYYRSYMYPDFDHFMFGFFPNIILGHLSDLVDWATEDIEPPTTLYFP
jgi:pimeloyl-ACP methyl ester carboxylesterase